MDTTPTVPEDALEGWSRTDERSETVFRLPTGRVVGHTVVYEDAALRSDIADATDGGIDRTFRFFFATRLTFSPPLPPGVGPAMVRSTVTARADREFADRLRERGFADVSTGRRERVRVESGERARLRAFEATLPLSLPGRETQLPVEGWLGVWAVDGEFRLAGGAYPARPLADVLDVAVGTDPKQFREELLALVRAVQ